MAQVLSQDEVDALLNAVNDVGADGGTAAAGAEDITGVAEEEINSNIQSYDLTNQYRVIR